MGKSRHSLTVRWDEIELFTQLLCRDLGDCCFRSVANREGFFGRKTTGFSRDWCRMEAKKGYPVLMVVNTGGQKNKEIVSARALFAEWDDQIPYEKQRDAWKLTPLPEPTFQVDTTHKSIHNYWVLEEDIDPNRWKIAQQRLIRTLNSDPGLKDPARAMRVPGFPYFNCKTRMITGKTVHIIKKNEYKTWNINDLEDCLVPMSSHEENQAMVAHRIDLLRFFSETDIELWRDRKPKEGRNARAFKLGCSLYAIESCIRGELERSHKLTFYMGAKDHVLDLCKSFMHTEGDGWNATEWNSIWSSITKEPRDLPAYLRPRGVRSIALAMLEGRAIPHQRTSKLEESKPLIVDELKKVYRSDPGHKDGWWRWNQKRWEHLDNSDPVEREVLLLCEDMGIVCNKSTEVQEIRKWLRINTGAFNPSSTMASRCLLPFNDKCYNFKENKTSCHEPENLNTWTLYCDYPKNEEDKDVIIKFLEDRIPNKQDLDMFLCWIHSILTGRSAKVFLELVGPSDTGKSVLARLCQALVGPTGQVTSSLPLLEGKENRFQTYKLRGKRLVVFNEAGDYHGRLDVLKALTGRDKVSAERKGSVENVDFYFDGGILLVGNEPISSTDCSDAIKTRRRTIFVDKKVPFESRKKLLEFDGVDWTGDLVAGLGSFIVWLLKQVEEGKLDPVKHLINCETGSQQRNRGEIEIQTNPVAEWADQTLVYDSRNAGTPVQDLYLYYCDWQDKTGRKQISVMTFGIRMRSYIRDVLGIKEYENSNYGRTSKARTLPGVIISNGMESERATSFSQIRERGLLPPMEDTTVEIKTGDDSKYFTQEDLRIF